MNNQPLLTIQNLKVDYFTEQGPAHAVDGVSFSISPGEVFGLAGESGCGKSTVAHSIMRILNPPAGITGGKVLFRNRNIFEMQEKELEQFRWRDVAMVFQSAMNALNPVMTVGDQIVDALMFHSNVSRNQGLDRARDLLNIVGIESRRIDSFPHELSGGMRQRAVIAIALALQPPLLILDEPTTALDVVVQKDIMQQIEQLQKKFNFSILFITHDLSLLVEFSNRIAIMYAGQIVEQSSARELFDHPLHPYTQGLMNSFPSISGDNRRLFGIPGNPPNLLHLPAGCRFYPRCSQAMSVCSQVAPSLIEVQPGHLAACHLLSKDA
ncbi:MAG: ABC transporter ATP-binding protein [Bacteroidales bacterium]